MAMGYGHYTLMGIGLGFTLGLSVAPESLNVYLNNLTEISILGSIITGLIGAGIGYPIGNYYDNKIQLKKMKK